MLTVNNAISRIRRDLAVAVAIRAMLVLVLLATFGVLPIVAPKVDRTAVVTVVFGIWLGLSYVSAKKSQIASESPALIASGQFELAEKQIEESLKGFSIYRATKLQSLHHLALLRHAQRQWPESAALCRALLGHRLGAVSTLNKPTRLLLADSAMEMGDLRGAYDALAGLRSQRMSLPETMNLLVVQVDYEARIGAWSNMVQGIMQKVQLAELMPTVPAARTQALLALASHNVGRADLSNWLRRRAELLVDPDRLKLDRPLLGALWARAGDVPAK